MEKLRFIGILAYPKMCLRIIGCPKYMWKEVTPLLNLKEVYKKIPSNWPMGYDKGVLWEFKTGFT